MAVERHAGTADIESVLCRLRDVMAVSAVADEGGNVSEIHILSGSSRSPKQVVRDVESALMARLGIAVDHKKISVAQVVDSSTRYDHSRLKFSDVSISLNGNRSEATVRLSKESEVYSGSADGVSSPVGQMKLIAGATLNAIERAGLTEAKLILEDVIEVGAAGRRVAVVVVSLVGDRTDDLLTGSALIKQDIWKGVVNATLDAVNRRLNPTRER